MCSKCEELNINIERYRRLGGQVNDQRTREAADRLIVELEAKKASLHSEEE
jgi:hypothetical protein